MAQRSTVHFSGIAEMAEWFGKSPRTIKTWIKDGKLEASKVNGGYEVLWDDEVNSVFQRALRQARQRIHDAYTPKELTEYGEWHTLLDELCWLLKVCYTPELLIKRKKFRTDIIFVKYIQAHKITLKKVRSVFAANQTHTLKAISDDLKRGWYNELAFVVPLRL